MLGRVVTARSQVEARGILASNAEGVVVVHRGRARTVLFNCPDGCGDTLVINVDAAAGQAWRLREDEGMITLMPSVWRSSGCQSHFIVWRSEIWWCHNECAEEDSAGRQSAPIGEWPAEMDQELVEEWRRIRLRWRRQPE